MREIIQQEVSTVTCDHCHKDVPEENISLRIFDLDLLLEEKDFCSAEHLLSWLESRRLEASILSEIPKEHTYFLRLEGEHMEDFIRLLQLQQGVKK